MRETDCAGKLVLQSSEKTSQLGRSKSTIGREEEIASAALPVPSQDVGPPVSAAQLVNRSGKYLKL